jgi:hypothetical protein
LLKYSCHFLSFLHEKNSIVELNMSLGCVFLVASMDFMSLDKRSITNIKKRNSLTDDDECYCCNPSPKWKKSLKFFCCHHNGFEKHVSRLERFLLPITIPGKSNFLEGRRKNKQNDRLTSTRTSAASSFLLSFSHPE